MSAVLDDLYAKRDDAQKAFDAFVGPLVEQGQLTPEQKNEKAELRGKIEALDERIDEVAKDEKRKANLDEIRKGLTKAEASAPKPGEGVTVESHTYGPGSPNSYVLDLARASSPAFRGHSESVRRLLAASHEFAVDYAHETNVDKRHKMERYVLQESRDSSPEAAKEALKEMRTRATVSRQEIRAMDTTASSGGSFATPLYFVEDYAPWKEYGRAFLDQCNGQPLPDYGMTINIPQIKSGASVPAQGTQNTPITEADPTAGYLTANLGTQAGQVTISQQILDRAGPNFAFDVMVFDQLRRDYNAKLDLAVITQVLGTTGVGAVPYTGSFALTAANSAASFRTKVASAKANTASTVGTVTTATHLYVTQARWEWIDAATDSQGRVLTVEDGNGPFNAVSNGSGVPVFEGDTGFKIAGLRVFGDSGIPTAGGTLNQDQAIVARMDEIWLFEGDPVTRTVPQTLANQLSVLLQLYNYWAAIVRYPAAVQVISGTAFNGGPTF